ncbi:MAG TPA: hypothetical protein VKV77_14585 [Methylovirgula sp.]|nr:hypothetical protein [Methylovirgula sp.]
MAQAHAEALQHHGRRVSIDPLTAGGALSVLGALLVVVTSLFYVVSPPAAAGPVQPLDLGAAVAAAVRGSATLRVAGTVGIFGDLIWTAAVMLVAQALIRRGQGLAAFGWTLFSLSILFFVFVDGMTGYVLPALAAKGEIGAFEGFKRLWDMLFLLGAAAYGAGIAIAMGAEAVGAHLGIGRRLAGAAALVATIGGLASVAGLTGATGLPVDKIAGASIGLGAILLVPISLKIAQNAAR